MFIKPLEKFYIPGGNIIESNKLRMRNIQKNISNMMIIEDLFYRLKEAIIAKDIVAISVIVSENMFFEEIFEGYEKEIIKAYESQADKEQFLRDLKKSYIMRGVKGFQFAWMPIILRKG
jgi:hypothetical protein